jgi:hypothetical protein
MPRILEDKDKDSTEVQIKILNYTAKMPVLRVLVLSLGITLATFGHIAKSSQAYTQKDGDIYGSLGTRVVPPISCGL